MRAPSRGLNSATTDGDQGMHDGSQGNAMTKIALALAMGFFSILVLTMVSMGAGHGGALRRLAGERQRAVVTGRSGRCTGRGCQRPSRF